MSGEKGVEVKVIIRILGEGVTTKEVGEGALVKDIIPGAEGRNIRINGEEAYFSSQVLPGDVIDVIPQYKNG